MLRIAIGEPSRFARLILTSEYSRMATSQRLESVGWVQSLPLRLPRWYTEHPLGQSVWWTKSSWYVSIISRQIDGCLNSALRQSLSHERFILVLLFSF